MTDLTMQRSRTTSGSHGGIEHRLATPLLGAALGVFMVPGLPSDDDAANP